MLFTAWECIGRLRSLTASPSVNSLASIHTHYAINSLTSLHPHTMPSPTAWPPYTHTLPSSTAWPPDKQTIILSTAWPLCKQLSDYRLIIPPSTASLFLCTALLCWLSTPWTANSRSDSIPADSHTPAGVDGRIPTEHHQESTEGFQLTPGRSRPKDSSWPPYSGWTLQRQA